MQISSKDTKTKILRQRNSLDRKPVPVLLVTIKLDVRQNAMRANKVKMLLGRSFTRSVHRCFSLSASEAVHPHLNNPAAENLRLRRQLAVSYRLLDKLGLNEGACNHLTVMAPARNGGSDVVMLLAPGRLQDGSSLHWAHITASSLIGTVKQKLLNDKIRRETKLMN